MVVAMTLLRPDVERLDDASYTLFRRAQQRPAWSARDLIGTGRTRLSPDRLELAWHTASRGHYAEQAELVAAAELAAATEDLAYRVSLATAVADEARHADAFLAYAVARGGRVADRPEDVDELHRRLTAAPYLEKCALHTMLEGFAADGFALSQRLFVGDPLAAIHAAVRGDEIRHVAIGLDHLRRGTRDGRTREEWCAGVAEWERVGFELARVDRTAQWLAGALGGSPGRIAEWFRRRHRARLRGAGLPAPAAGSTRREEVTAL